MNTLAKKGKLYLGMTCILMVVYSLFTVLYTYYLAEILVSAQAMDSARTVEMIVKTLGVRAVMFVSSVSMDASRMAYQSDGEVNMKMSIIKNILERPSSIFRQKNEAYYLNLLTNDVDVYRSDFLSVIPYVFNSVSSFLFAAIALYLLNPWLMLTGLVLAFLPLAINKIFINLETKAKKEYSEESERHMAVLKETLEGFAEIRNDNHIFAFLKKNEDAVKKKRYAQSKYVFVDGVSSEVFFTFASLSMVIGYAVGAVLVLKGVLNPILMIAAQSYLVSMSNHVSNISGYMTRIFSTKEIKAKLDGEMEKKGEEKQFFEISAQPVIKYKDVTFGFENKQLYKNLSCQFDAKGCYLILGESGSGKSSLIKLLLKQYDNYEGEILLDGKNIKDLTEENIYKCVGLVTQSAYIFNASLYDNITMFTNTPAKDSTEYKNLLKRLNLEQLAKQVGDEPLGDFGDRISGGERQRISLARVMRQRREILIFDEPTTGLDPENVNLINDFIFNCKDVLRIVISHDWSMDYRNRFDGVVQIGK